MKILLISYLISTLFLNSDVFAQSTAREFFEQGQSALSQGNNAKAIDFFEKSIEVDSDFALAYSALGSVYLDNNGKTEDVVWLFEQAAQLEPQNVENYANMCRAHFQVQEHDRAEVACLKALSIDPNFGSAQLLLAWIYLLGKSQPADSVKYFNEVIKRIPNNPKIFYGLGMAYAKNNEQAKALDVITNLRAMGEESLASQLERLMRPGGIPDAMIQTLPQRPMVDTALSKVVKAMPETPAPVASGSSPSGTVRIQLRGKLNSTVEPSADGASSKGKDSKEDGGYGVQDYPELSIKERVDRVRRLRGNSGSGRGQGSVTLQPPSP